MITHSGVISVISDHETINITVQVSVVSSDPVLAFSPASFDFGTMQEGENDSTSFDIWNGDSGCLTYSLSENCNWVSVNPTSGFSTGEYDTIVVDIDTTGLSDGTYSCDIDIVSNGGNGVFTVEVTIGNGDVEVLDVNQSVYDRGFRLMSSWDACQEFVPSYDTLSHVDLYMSKFGSPTGNVTFQICNDSASGTVLFEGMLSPDEVTGYPDYDWVSVDLSNLSVIVNDTYCIVLKNASGADTHNCVQWGYCDSYPSGSGGPYDGGWFWFRKDGNPNWAPIRDWDYTFRTYGYS